MTRPPVEAPRGVVSLWRYIVRHRWTVVVILGVVGGIVVAAQGYLSIEDPGLFVRAGRQLMSSDGLNVYRDPAVQVGPLHLLVFWLASVVGDALNVDLIWPLSIAVHVTFVLLLMYSFEGVMEDDTRAAAGAVVVLTFAALALGLGWTEVVFGQFSDGLVALMWIHAALAARKNRSLLTGFWIGLATGLKVWGILGLPLLLLLPTVRERLRAAACLGAITVVLYGPFLIFGDVRTFGFRWLIAPGSPWTWLYRTSADVTWVVRAVEGVLILAIGLAAIWLGRSTRAVLWGGPLAIAGARIFTDPEFWPWYLLAAAIPALIGAAYLLARKPTATRVILAVGAASISLLPEGPWLGLLALAVAFVAMITEKSMVVRTAA